MKIDSRFHFRNGIRLKGLLSLPVRVVRLCRGAATVAGGGVAGVVPGSLSAPAPNARRQPAGGHPGSTQRVQRLRQLFVAGDSSEDSFAARTLCGLAHAGSPLGFLCVGRVSPHSVRLPRFRYRRARRPPMLRSCMSQRSCLFSLPGQKKERGS